MPPKQLMPGSRRQSRVDTWCSFTAVPARESGPVRQALPSVHAVEITCQSDEGFIGSRGERRREPQARVRLPHEPPRDSSTGRADDDESSCYRFDSCSQTGLNNQLLHPGTPRVPAREASRLRPGCGTHRHSGEAGRGPAFRRGGRSHGVASARRGRPGPYRARTAASRAGTRFLPRPPSGVSSFFLNLRSQAVPAQGRHHREQPRQGGQNHVRHEEGRDR